jgi:hypothetical protein
MELPEHIANWRGWRDDGRLTFQHLRRSSPGRKLLEMRSVRMNAVRPVWFACLMFLCQTLCKAPILQRAFCAIFPMFTHIITLTIVAAALLSHKFPSVMTACLLSLWNTGGTHKQRERKSKGNSLQSGSHVTGYKLTAKDNCPQLSAALYPSPSPSQTRGINPPTTTSQCTTSQPA